MKNCPRHSVELTANSGSETQTEQCPQCTGIWVPGSQIDQLLGAGQMLQLRSLCSITESELRCPSDCGLLHQGQVGPVVVDLCQECGGLWLDPGELETLRKRRGITPYRPPVKDDVLYPKSTSGEEAIIPCLMLLLS